MRFLKLVIGFMLLFLSFGYLYYPNSIIKLNSFFKYYIFNDELIINHRRKIGAFLLFLAIIALYMGTSAKK